MRRWRWLGIACALWMLALGGIVRAGAPRQDAADTFTLAAENDSFQLFVDDQTLAFRVMDKRSGYTWHSGIDEPLDDDRLNRSWRAFAQSGISIDTFDAKGVRNRVSVTNAEHTLSMTPIEQGISAQVTFTEFGITVGVVLQLEADGVRVELPYAGIQEADTDHFRLARVYVFPFMGATRGSSTPGYMLLPDGAGSLIRFADTTRATNMFYGRYYGPDLGMIGNQPYDPLVIPPYPISYPVFGMAHGEGQNAFVTVIEQGAAYAELQAHPSGIITNFNFLYNTFIYNQSYFQATNRSGAGVTTVQQQSNRFDAVMHYRFLTGEDADYVGMARSYQRYLLDNGLLRQNEFTNPNIGIRLEFLGGDKEPALLWTRFVPMTTVAQISEILAGLGVPNPEVVYYGWQPNGATSMPPSSLSLDGALGSADELRALTGQIAEQGGHFSLYFDPQAAIWREAGYSARNDLAMAITDVNLQGYTRYPTYYFSYQPLEQRTNALATSLAGWLNVGLALDGIGATVYGDFREGQSLNREAAIDAYQALLAQIPLRLAFYRPNDYVYSLTQAYYDMPADDNGYIFTSEAVPFLPIVLAGYVPQYGGALNFSSGRQRDLLRLVEYGIYPSYFLTSEATSAMLNTPSAWIYSSSYAQWGDQIRSAYDWMNNLLGPVRGQTIINHEALADGVFATTYSSGAQIVVNFTGSPIDLYGVTVEPQDARLVEGRP